MMLKLLTDMGMIILLLLLMGYELVGQAAHEWLGIGIFALFVLHHILNGSWMKHIFQGRYTFVRAVQTALVCAVFLAMAGSAVSGVILSRHALTFLPIHGGRSFARNLHMISAYWGYLFLSMHLGFHAGMLLGIAKKHGKDFSKAFGYFLRGIAALLVVYGVYAFYKRGIGGYLFLQTRFVFFDFEEPYVFFLMDYIAIMGLFVWIGHFLLKRMKDAQRNHNRGKVE